MQVPPAIMTVLQALHVAGGTPLIVGGAVRDWLMGFEPADFDIEVFGLDGDAVLQALLPLGRVDAVGKSFGVLQVRVGDVDVDVSLPRRENKAGRGHKGFLVTPDPTMTIAEACARRDFTINSAAYNLFAPPLEQLIDPLDGAGDLAAELLHPSSPAFCEDPLRVLRGMQFAARFEFCASLRLAEYAIAMWGEYGDLPAERIWSEWAKWAQKGRVPSYGLELLRVCSWDRHYPELVALQGCVQDARHHPEGDAWTHTLHVVDAMAGICVRDHVTGDDRLVAIFAALCHDLGKPATTERHVDGRITSYGHDEAGEAPTRSFLACIGFPERLVERVVVLVREHMAHVPFHMHEVTPRAVRRLAQRLDARGSSIREWARVVEADHSGRPPLPGGLPQQAAQILALAEELGVLSAAVPPLLMGRHLIARGVVPGPPMGQLLRVAYEAQLDGAFATLADAEAWLDEQLRTNGNSERAEP
jgi:tRNA nucleotidyltransferase (CCA-adding enzyme)